MSKSILMTPIETAELVSAAMGEHVNPRQVVWWARNGSGGFPPLARDWHNKQIRFSRSEVEAWLHRFTDDSGRAVKDADARHTKVVKRGRRARS